MRTVEAAIITNEKQKLRMVKKMKKLMGGNFKSKIISILVFHLNQIPMI